MKRVWAASLLLVWGLTAWAQSTNNFAFVIYAEGNDFSVYRNGELQTFDVMLDDVVGMPLLPGDMVQTDRGTYVEIQIMPARSVIKVAANTTFQIDRLGGTGGGSFNVSYGRVRARVERVTGNDPFEVRGLTAVAGVRGTDFGFDMVIERDALEELQTRVYCFEGSVEVSEPEPAAADDGAADGGDPGTDQPQIARSQPIVIGANEMVNVISEIPQEMVDAAARVVEGDSPLQRPSAELLEQKMAAPRAPAAQKVSFQTVALKQDVQTFWQERDFQEAPIDPARIEERFPGIQARVDRLNAEQQRFQELQRLRREGLLPDPSEYIQSDAPAAPRVQAIAPREVPLQVDSVAIQRLITSEQVMERSRRARIAGHWLTGMGLVLGSGGALGVHFVDNAGRGGAIGPTAYGASMITGGVFIVGGVISYVISVLVTR